MAAVAVDTPCAARTGTAVPHAVRFLPSEPAKRPAGQTCDYQTSAKLPKRSFCRASEEAAIFVAAARNAPILQFVFNVRC